MQIREKYDMKRIISLLLLAMVTVVLFSCGGEYPEPVEQEVAFEKISHMLCPGVGKDGMFVFNSREELETYYEENHHDPGSYRPGIDFVSSARHDSDSPGKPTVRKGPYNG